jgi:hypothetical protein
MAYTKEEYNGNRDRQDSSEASEKISKASGAPREVLEDVDGTGEEGPVYQKNKTNVLQALGVLRGYCAMSKVEKEAEDEKKALANHGAVPMVVCGLGEKNIRVAGIKKPRVWPKNKRGPRWDSKNSRGYEQEVGLAQQRAGKHEHEQRKKRKIPYIRSETEKMEKPEVWPKKRGPRWDSNQNPRGYEQEIGPAQQRTGKHEPSSYACNRAHKSYIHQEKMEKPEAWPKKGAHDGTRPEPTCHVGMSKRLDLRNKGQESTGHVISGMPIEKDKMRL